MGYNPTMDHGVDTARRKQIQPRDVLRRMVGIPFFHCLCPNPSARHTERAIISSSSVRMTQTMARPGDVDDVQSRCLSL